jgi:hypothetical protein
MKGWTLELSLSLGLIGVSMLVAACGQVKDRDDKVVVADTSNSTENAEKASTEDAIRKFSSTYSLFVPKDGVSRPQLQNLFEYFLKKNSLLGSFFSKSSISADQVVDVLFHFDRNGDGKLNIREVHRGLESHVPTLGWAPEHKKLCAPELKASVKNEYPEASPSARAGLVRTLSRFGERWAGGDGDGLLSRRELSTAGLILGAIPRIDLQNGIAGNESDPMQNLVLEQIENKLNEQLYLRYEVPDFRRLSSPDSKLEWSQLALRFVLIDGLVQEIGRESGCAGRVPFSKIREALLKWGGIALADATVIENDMLFRLYDSPLTGGDGDGQFNTIELFNFVTDWTYAAQITSAAGESPESMGKQKDLLAHLNVLYRHIGRNIFSNAQYWASLRAFDNADRGGNENGHFDATELLMALNYVRLLDNIYAIYDTNRDGTMTKDEIKPFFKEMGIESSLAIDAFFNGVGLDGKSSKIGTTLKVFFSRKKNVSGLTPYPFYQRMEAALPQILNSK